MPPSIVGARAKCFVRGAGQAAVRHAHDSDTTVPANLGHRHAHSLSSLLLHVEAAPAAPRSSEAGTTKALGRRWHGRCPCAVVARWRLRARWRCTRRHAVTPPYPPPRAAGAGQRMPQARARLRRRLGLTQVPRSERAEAGVGGDDLGWHRGLVALEPVAEVDRLGGRHELERVQLRLHVRVARLDVGGDAQ